MPVFFGYEEKRLEFLQQAHLYSTIVPELISLLHLRGMPYRWISHRQTCDSGIWKCMQRFGYSPQPRTMKARWRRPEQQSWWIHREIQSERWACQVRQWIWFIIYTTIAITPMTSSGDCWLQDTWRARWTIYNATLLIIWGVKLSSKTKLWRAWAEWYRRFLWPGHNIVQSWWTRPFVLFCTSVFIVETQTVVLDRGERNCKRWRKPRGWGKRGGSLWGVASDIGLYPSS